MKKSINDIIKLVEDWNVSDLERLQSELEDQIEIALEDTCEDCDNRPMNGACFYCKQD